MTTTLATSFATLGIAYIGVKSAVLDEIIASKQQLNEATELEKNVTKFLNDFDEGMRPNIKKLKSAKPADRQKLLREVTSTVANYKKKLSEMNFGDYTSAVKVAMKDISSALKRIEDNIAHIDVNAANFSDQQSFTKIETAASEWSQGKKDVAKSFADDTAELKAYPTEAAKHLKLLSGFEGMNKDHKIAQLDTVEKSKRPSVTPQFKKAWDNLKLANALNGFAITSSGQKFGVHVAEIRTALNEVESTFREYQKE